MDDHFRNIIKQLKCQDNINNFEELIKYIEENNLEELKEELDFLNIFDTTACSFSVPDLFLPTPSGTNFFSNYNPFQSMNAIIPDIFRLCIIKEPKEYQIPLVSVRISPKIRLSFPDVGAAVLTRYQKLLPLNIIKSFFYFGYKSNFEDFNVNNITFLEIKIQNYIKNALSTSASYTDPEIIFNQLYDTDTLIQNMIQLHNLLNTVREEKTDLTNIGSFNLPYLFSYYVNIQVLKDDSFNINKYSNLRDKNTTALSYTDLVYLNYLNKLISDNLIFDNFITLLNSKTLGFEVSPEIINTLTTAVEFTKNNNIFILIETALEVKQYILNVISYNLNNKSYYVEDYAKPVYLAITKKLYCNYANNENYNYPELNVPDYCL
jgi:hypothetical protein